MLRLARFALVALSAALLLLAAACGGDDDSTDSQTDAPTATDAPSATDSGDTSDNEASAELLDYFAAMEEIAARTDDALEEVDSDLSNATFANDSEEVEANKDGLQRSGEAIEQSLLGLSDLDPPPEVEAAHSEFFDSLNAVLQLFAAMSAEVEDVTTTAGLEEINSHYRSDFFNADGDFDSACLSLQDIADNHDIDVDLRCTD